MISWFHDFMRAFKSLCPIFGTGWLIQLLEVRLCNIISNDGLTYRERRSELFAQQCRDINFVFTLLKTINLTQVSWTVCVRHCGKAFRLFVATLLCSVPQPLKGPSSVLLSSSLSGTGSMCLSFTADCRCGTRNAPHRMMVHTAQKDYWHIT